MDGRDQGSRTKTVVVLKRMLTWTLNEHGNSTTYHSEYHPQDHMAEYILKR